MQSHFAAQFYILSVFLGSTNCFSVEFYLSAWNPPYCYYICHIHDILIVAPLVFKVIKILDQD